MENKDCNTCKYCTVRGDLDPCDNCQSDEMFLNWEAKEMELKLIKNCETCMYRGRGPLTDPCLGCEDVVVPSNYKERK